jgi:hypothetical protein
MTHGEPDSMSDNKVTVQLGKERETKNNGRGRMMFKPPGNPKCERCERRIKGAIYFQSSWHGRPTCGDCAREIEWQRVVTSHELFARAEPLPDRANTRADQLPQIRPCEVCGREIGWAVFRRHQIRTWTCSSIASGSVRTRDAASPQSRRSARTRAVARRSRRSGPTPGPARIAAGSSSVGRHR